MTHASRGFRLFLVCILAGCVRRFPSLQWPNALLTYADIQLFEFGALSGFLQGCPTRDDTTIAAQWLRIAYHDMSTHDIDTGTGGLDASIQYELANPQNVGIGMAASLVDFNNFGVVTKFFGMADAIALGMYLGAVFSAAACGGPIIPFSAGRVDATVAGPATVPEPQDTLASHIESFRQQGFNQTEMIALVTCGHTIGGVRQVDFPQIVTDPSIGVDLFDTTPAFDNTIISQYLQNTTEDVLVVGPNVTTRSDFRIFSSDGNVTMQNLLSPDTFNETYGALIQRMINTVPAGVTLTDPFLEPFNYLVNDPYFSYQSGSLYDNCHPSNPSVCPPAGCSAQSPPGAELLLSIIGKAQGLTAERYFLNATINATSSISRFWFEIDNNDGSDPIVVDNGGSGFVIVQDTVFVDVSRSKLIFDIPPSGTTDVVIRIVIAVFGDAASINGSLAVFDPVSTAPAPPFLPTITSIDLQLDESNPAEGGYTFFTANASISATFMDVAVTGDGVAFNIANFNLGSAPFSVDIIE